MVIANPIYDVVFKRLMEDNRIAKFFIGTLFEQVIESVEVKPQEFTYTDELAGLAVFRLDFLATVKTETGELKKVLIEIQKAKNQIDLMRFRNYLGEQYKKEDIVNDKQGVGRRTALPITTIYILGFSLPEIKEACIKVERNYRDLISKKIIDTKSDFVEKLTHDSYIVQVGRITNRYQTRLDKLLSVFEQTNFLDDTKITKEFKHDADIEEVKIITDILHYSGTDPVEKKKLETEQEAWRTVDALTGDLKEKSEKLIQELNDNKKALTESEKALTEKNLALTESEKALTEKDLALTEKDLALTEKNLALTEKNLALTESEKTNIELLKQLEELKRRFSEK